MEPDVFKRVSGKDRLPFIHTLIQAYQNGHEIETHWGRRPFFRLLFFVPCGVHRKHSSLEGKLTQHDGRRSCAQGLRKPVFGPVQNCYHEKTKLSNYRWQIKCGFDTSTIVGGTIHLLTI